MSVPLALEAILTLGQAYGLQLHTELTARLPHRASTNVGQIYSTLERLKRDGFIRQDGATADGLPLYSLTDSGQDRAQQWIIGALLTAQSEWIEFLDVIMMAVTIPNASLDKLQTHIASATAHTQSQTVGERSQGRLYQAIQGTMLDAVAANKSGDIEERGLKTERPQRGRRPRASVK